MDGFTYYNIFDTKGIEYLAIIAFFALLIPFWFILNKQTKTNKQIQHSLGILTSSMLEIPQGLFFSKNHTWAHLDKSGIAKIGLDDLLLHITGEVKLSNLKNEGEIIKKGDLLSEISHNGKHLKIYSPITGEVIKTNVALKKDQAVINDDPYNNGWVYRVKPFNWVAETNSYYLAEDASDWSAKELDRFKDFLANSMGKYSADPSRTILQDGGELRDQPLSELPIEVWHDFQQNFLNV
ncbi:MAG: glycine cleavage system protein H [Omnitrophica WOR_2 bacterium]|jgi:glycine cleavage system H protein